MSPNTILILGAGPRVGWSVAQKFTAGGYRVAVASRKPDIEAATKAGFLPITVDLSSILSVEAAFVQVTKQLGVPNVVVYNAAKVTFPKDLTDPFASISPEAFVNDNNVTLLGTYVAIKEAVAGFHKLRPEIPKAFIVTGSILPWKAHPAAVTLGPGKAGAAQLVEIGALAYNDKQFRFYFASEVTAEGGFVSNTVLSGSAHGEVFWELANKKEKLPSDVRFLGNGKIMPAN